jgi:Ulp1 family protease
LDDEEHRNLYGENSAVLNSIFRNSTQAILSLCEGERLNDTVITYVMKSLTVNFPSKSKCTIDTFLQKQIDLDGKDVNASEQRMRKMFKKMLQTTSEGLEVFVPINPHGEHWSLMKIDVERHVFTNFCSLARKTEDYRKTTSLIALIGKVINSILPNHKRGVWTSLNKQGIPIQSDGVSCGLYLSIFAKCLYFDQDIECTTKMINDLRKELMNKFKEGQKAGFLTFEEPYWERSQPGTLQIYSYYYIRVLVT